MAIIINCFICGTEREISKKDFDDSKSGKHFCSHSCSAKYTNKNRVSDAGKTKLAICKKCGLHIVVGKRAPSDNVLCDECKRKYHRDYDKIYWLTHERKRYPTIKETKEKQLPVTKTTRVKEAICIKCSVAFLTIRGKYCENCRPNRKLLPEQRKPHKKTILYEKELTCIRCGTTFIAKTAKYCKICLKEVRREIGCKAVLAQGDARRSKNEIHFANMCKALFETVLENAPIFNKWDADVIIPEFKIAVLWNGNWHRQKITKQHSVKQVQSRDRIKQKEIIKAGYHPYVIEDFGKENIDFVQEQFLIFLRWLTTHSEIPDIQTLSLTIENYLTKYP